MREISRENFVVIFSTSIFEKKIYEKILLFSFFLFYGNFAQKFNSYIFHFQFQKFIQEIPRPYHIFHLLIAHLGRTNRSRNIIIQWIVVQYLIDKNYLIFRYYFIIIRIINWDIWLEQKNLQINNLFLFIFIF